jgi:cytochrome c
MRFDTQRFTLVLTSGLTLALAACGGSGGGSEAPAPAPVATETQAEPASTEPAPEPAPVETAAPPAAGATFADFTGDAAKGKRVFAQCMTCHVVQEGRNNVGPSLYQIVGRQAGTVAGFGYSDANKGSGVTWTEENLFNYLENPAEYIPGTIMAFPGLRNPQDRADVIAYLKNPS